MKKLTDKQKLFVFEYLIDRNATQAAIRAGYSKKTAYAIGIENLKKPEIQKFLEQYQSDRAERCGVKFDEILGELKKIGFANIDIDNIKASDKIKALDVMSKLLGYDRMDPDENIEDVFEAEKDVFGE